MNNHQAKKMKLENGSNEVIIPTLTNEELHNLRVGSRKSQLALFQTNYVVDLLRKQCPTILFDIVTMSTIGDKILDVALSKIGQKSLFTKELEVALEQGQVHAVVHSLKDLPTTLPPGMVIGAICKRENPYDVAVFSPSVKYTCLKDFPDGSVIGTSSLRRIAQLKRSYPKLTFESIRGNLNTRLRKLDEDNRYSALILAAAGLIRLDLAHRITMTLDPEECMYAVGQGALAIECKEDDVSAIELISKLSDRDTVLCCIAERAFMRTLEGGCSVPIAVKSSIEEDELILQGGVFSLDGSKQVIEELSTNLKDNSKKHILPKKHYTGIIAPHMPHRLLHASESLGEALAKLCLLKGAGEILKDVRATD